MSDDESNTSSSSSVSNGFDLLSRVCFIVMLPGAISWHSFLGAIYDSGSAGKLTMVDQSRYEVVLYPNILEGQGEAGMV